MTLDVISAVIIIILTGFGYFTGALTQVTRIIGLILAFLAAPVLAAVYKEILFGPQWPGGATWEWGMLLLAGASVYGTVSLLGFLLSRLMHKASDEMSATDKSFGAFIGLFKALGVVYLLISSLVLVLAPLERADPEDALQIRSSLLLAAVQHQQSIFMWSIPDMGKLRELLSTPTDLLEKELKTDPAGERLLLDSSLQNLMQDPKVREDANNWDISKLMENPDVRKILADDDVLRDLHQLQPIDRSRED